jgi:large subunit ribosomal protein L18
MDRIKKKKQRRLRIKRGIRKNLKGTSERPRLTVFRSNSEIYAQIIDDISGNTLVSVSSIKPDFDKKGKSRTEISALIGKSLSEKAKEAGIETVIFDRNGFLYHGRVKALADGAREGGLIF